MQSGKELPSIRKSKCKGSEVEPSLVNLMDIVGRPSMTASELP